MTQADREAADWLAILSKTSIANEDLKAFFEWRNDPENRRAYETASAADTSEPDSVQLRHLKSQTAFVAQIAIFAASGVVALAVTGGMILFVAHAGDTFAYGVAAVMGIGAGLGVAGYLDRELRIRSN